ncbi:Hypp7133 [Branchiostoma lanceolatum]|uniref:Hypp7133 protein n=1 Tax=Branchiostoma lanceolatum TaxID=7740 RepID=A0A8J9YXU1_BRALA|nr:Hypp7133 [Branchiostoma lanceolatum]
MKVTSSPSISLFAANRLRGRTSICGLLFGKAIFHVRASSSLGRFVLAMTTPACSVRSLEDGDSGDKSSQNCKKLKGVSGGMSSSTTQAQVSTAVSAQFSGGRLAQTTGTAGSGAGSSSSETDAAAGVPPYAAAMVHRQVEYHCGVSCQSPL